MVGTLKLYSTPRAYKDLYVDEDEWILFIFQVSENVQDKMSVKINKGITKQRVSITAFQRIYYIRAQVSGQMTTLRTDILIRRV